jgi:hypothetical protein
MQGVVLLPTSDLDIFWLDHNFAMFHSNWAHLYGPPLTIPDPLGGIFTTPPRSLFPWG